VHFGDDSKENEDDYEMDEKIMKMVLGIMKSKSDKK